MTALLAAPNLDSATGLRDRCLMELMYRAGLRVGEVCRLEPRDVDLEGGTVRVIDGKGGDGTAYFDPDSVSELLKRWKHKRQQLGFRNSQHLFCTIKLSDTPLGGRKPAGGPVSVRQVEDMIKRRARKAGLDPTKVTPHVLRHTFATELLDEGLHIRDVQEAMRHANLATSEVYLHVLDTDLRRKIAGRVR